MNRKPTLYFLKNPVCILLYSWFVLFGLGSCASYSTKYARQNRNWKADVPDPGQKVAHTLYLIGDAGYDSPQDTAQVLYYLKKRLKKEPASSSIIFLGDNIYQYGMPPKEDSTARETAEYRINSQLETLHEFKGRPVFLPGNHDWWGWGVDGLRRQEEYVQETIATFRPHQNRPTQERYFLPQAGCPGPEVVELSDRLALLVIDSQWWLTNRDENTEEEAACAVNSREKFKNYFQEIAQKYKDRQLVVALHHPLYTFGPHAGRVTFKEHIFPLTELNPNLYIPLPGIGSLVALYRGLIGSRQDVANARYKKLRRALLKGTRQNPGTIFVSGHEHTLQYIRRKASHFIVSGSGSKQSPVGLGRGSVFASSAMGYSTLTFYANGQSWVQFWDVRPDGEKANLLFQKKIQE